MKKNIFIIVLFLFFVFCTPFRQINTIKNLQYSIDGINIDIKDLFNLGINVNIGIYNPNNTEITITNLEYTIRLNGEEIAKGRSEDKIIIKKRDKTIYRTKVYLNFNTIKKYYMDLYDTQDNKIIVNGKITFNTVFGNHTFPFLIEKQINNKEFNL